MKTQPDNVEFRRSLASTHAALAIQAHRLRRDEEAIVSCNRAIELQEDLVAAHPEVAAYRFSLASSYNTLGLCQPPDSINSQPGGLIVPQGHRSPPAADGGQSQRYRIPVGPGR